MATFPEPGASERVIFDPTGGGGRNTPEPPVVGHSTIHLLGEDEEENEAPLCGLELGNNITIARRVEFDSGLDECARCKEA